MHSLFAPQYSLATFRFGEEKSLQIKTSLSSSTDYDMTGAIVWPASELLCWFILKHPDFFRGRRIIELGSGASALPGLVVSGLASIVCLTDGMPELIEKTVENIDINKATFAPGTSVSAHVLRWGDDDSLAATLHEEFHGQPVDVILGADIVVWENVLPQLFHTIGRIFAHHRAAAGGSNPPVGAEGEAAWAHVPCAVLTYQRRFLSGERTMAQLAETEHFRVLRLDALGFLGPEEKERFAASEHGVDYALMVLMPQ
eukprot:GAFH01003339.1.p1 GENE.GAFH01003339.1~~GAFH01003339.1.p1  ORF type:complete len:280 (+),score=45.59 GAFH01003339.1:72-842(+)